MEYKTKYLQIYEKLTFEIINYFDGNKDIEKYITELNDTDDIIKITSGIKFNRELNKDENVKELFIKKKVKIFSSKSENTKEIATILFNNLSLKKLLNKQKEEFTENIWVLIQAIFCFAEYIDKKEENISKTSKELFEYINNTPLITKIFADNDVVIAFPQMDIHLHTQDKN